MSDNHAANGAVHQPSQRAEELVGKSNEELARIDPLVMNLLVAKGIPSLADLDIERYRAMLDEAAAVLRRELPGADRRFCGSDLRAVTPHEMLGLFFGLRARHLENINRFEEAEPDYLLARYLFPQNRHLAIAQHQVSVQLYQHLFEPPEKGHPIELADWLRQVVEAMGFRPQPSTSIAPQKRMEVHYAGHVTVFDAFFAGPGFALDG
jgi:hypothetical protein